MKPFLLLSIRADDAAAHNEYASFLSLGGLREREQRRVRLERSQLARDPADHASLDYLQDDVAALLVALREAGASDAVTTLATRAANAGMFELSSRLILTRLPATCSGASQTAPSQDPGDGKNRPAGTARSAKKQPDA